MKKLGNKGFTLVEMAVAFAILAIITLSVTLVITTSSNTYSKIAMDINLQYESQIAMSQLQEYVIDCNSYIAVNFSGSNLYVFNKSDGTHYEAYKFAKKADSDELYFYKRSIDTSNLPSESSNFTFAADTGELMSSYVKAFSAVVTSTSVTITIDYASGDKTYSGQQTIALRNQVQNVSSSVPSA